MNFNLIYTTLFFISGIILGRIFLYFPFSVLILSAISFIFIIILDKGRRLRSVVLCLITISAVIYYLFSATGLPEDHISRFLNQEVVLKGIVLNPPERSAERMMFYLGVEEIYLDGIQRASSGKVRLSGEIKNPIQYGDIILVKTKLKIPRGYHNPGGYDFKEALSRDKIFAIGWVKEENIVRVGSGGSYLLRKIYDGRDTIRISIENSLNSESSAILQSMVIGEDRGLTDEIRDAFMASGTTHILSISGSHLGLLAFLIYNIVRLSLLRLPSMILLRLTLYTSPSKIAALSTIPPVILYTIIAGGKVATIRSLIMILVYLLAILIEKKDRLINSLAFAAIIILFLNPQALFDISFQLSYGSILSIGYFLNWWKVKEPSKIPPGLEIKEKGFTPKAKKRLTEYILIAVAATLGTAPLVAYYFNQFSWVGLFSNIIVIPLAGAVIVPLGLFSGFLTLLSGSSTLPLASLTAKAVTSFYFLVKTFSKIPYAAIHLPSPSIILIALYYIFLYTLLEWRKAKWIKIISVSASSLIILLTIPSFLNSQDGIKANFIDVGQGDSSLIELPDGKRMLIDGGGAYEQGFDIGRRVLAPYLWDKGIRRIDYLVISHPHPDHIRGLFYIIKKFDIKEAWIADHAFLSDGYSEILNPLKERGIPFLALKRGDAIFKDDYKIYVLHPYPEFYPASPRGEFSEQNNCSLVLKIVYKNHSLLFTGDIEMEAEEDLIHLGDWLKADIIKVPHHGGRTSSGEGFLFYVRPSMAVVSSGRDNIFNHPHMDVIERYEGSGVKVCRTDRDGAVIIRSDGENLRLETFDTLSLEKIHFKDTLFSTSLWDMEKRNIRRLWKGIWYAVS